MPLEIWAAPGPPFDDVQADHVAVEPQRGLHVAGAENGDAQRAAFGCDDICHGFLPVSRRFWHAGRRVETAGLVRLPFAPYAGS